MRVLFVCSANTCRSPMAEALFQEKVKTSNVEVRSAGTSAFNGDPVLPSVLSVLEERGIHYSHKSQRVNPELIDWADLVLTMTKSEKYILFALFPEIAQKVSTLKEFVGNSDNPNINNPVGGNLSSYRRCAEELEQTLHSLQEKLEHVKSSKR